MGNFKFHTPYSITMSFTPNLKNLWLKKINWNFLIHSLINNKRSPGPIYRLYIQFQNLTDVVLK